MYPLPFELPSHSGPHCVLSRVHCAVQYVLIEIESENRSLVSNFLWPHGLYSPWNSPGQNTGVGSLSLLQGIFPTQGSNPCLPHCRRILSQLSYQGSSHQLSILYMVSIEYMCQSQSPSSSHPSFPFGIHIFVLYICVPISALHIEKNFLYHILMHICGI